MRLTWTNGMKALAGLTTAAGILCAAGRAEAAPYTHDGFYLQLNAGLGYMTASSEQAGITQKLYGATLPCSSLLLGGTVGPVVIGGGFFADHALSPGASVNGQKQNVDITMTLISIGAFADIYPDPHQGLHIQPFIGWGGLERSINGNSGGSDPTGLVLALGGGYDFFVSDNWSIGGMARLTYAPLKIDDVSVSVFAPSLLATFTYH